MALHAYGVLVGRATDSRREGGTDSPHHQIQIEAGGASYRIAVNVLSQQAPSELLYLVDDDLRHPVTAALEPLGSGWHELPSQPGGASLDFIRGNLFDRRDMRRAAAGRRRPRQRPRRRARPPRPPRDRRS